MKYRPNYHEDNYRFRRTDAWTGAEFADEPQHTNKGGVMIALLIAVLLGLVWTT